MGRMTAEEWDGCPRSDWMLLPLADLSREAPALAPVHDRKLRLYAVACCRQLGDMFDEEPFRRAVEAGERLADGRADPKELADLHDAIMAIPTTNARSHCIEEMALKLVRERGILCALHAAWLGSANEEGDYDGHGFECASRAQAPILRCIFGNPFRPVAFDPNWRTPAVVDLAGLIDADRAFDLMPILADALEDAGCARPEVVAHCRGDGPHARGCWVIDGLLGEAGGRAG